MKFGNPQTVGTVPVLSLKVLSLNRLPDKVPTGRRLRTAGDEQHIVKPTDRKNSYSLSVINGRKKGIKGGAGPGLCSAISSL